MADLLVPVEEFLIDRRDIEISSLIYCSIDTTFMDLIGLFVTNRIHRVYVLDSDGVKPLAVITPTDILRRVVQNAPQ